MGNYFTGLNKNTDSKMLTDIKAGTLVHAEWTTFLKKIRPLG
jgi:hypothetical protein